MRITSQGHPLPAFFTATTNSDDRLDLVPRQEFHVGQTIRHLDTGDIGTVIAYHGQTFASDLYVIAWDNDEDRADRDLYASSDLAAVPA